MKGNTLFEKKSSLKMPGRNFIFCVFVLCFSFFSCGTLKNQIFFCPYEIESAEISVSEKNSCVEAVFEIKNVSGKNISSFSVCFSVTDEEGNFASDGAEEILFYGNEEILQGECRLFTVLLDEYFEEFPDTELYIENFFIREIKFADGKRWTDFFGMYDAGS